MSTRKCHVEFMLTSSKRVCAEVELHREKLSLSGTLLFVRNKYNWHYVSSSAFNFIPSTAEVEYCAACISEEYNRVISSIIAAELDYCYV